jgi:ABC-type multidrug transport system fused ATPase/permease subunit
VKSISLKNLLIRFKWRVSLTFLLVIAEATLDVFYPLFIGFAIDGLFKDDYTNLIYLAILGVVSLSIGALRRFYDTRVYGGIYAQIAPEMVHEESTRGSSISTISARSSLLNEFVEFLENSMPEILRGIVSLVGVLLAIAVLNLQVFFACLGILVLIILIYAITGRLNYRLNASYNNQLEQQVNILRKNDARQIKRHYFNLTRWNIYLSDLETVNYAIIWLGVIALLVYTPLSVTAHEAVTYGVVSSILMYVTGYIDNALIFPYYIQQVIRLKEITRRMAGEQKPPVRGHSL